MSNPFAILKDYPEDGPEVPQREKVTRSKDRHVPGNNRRDKTKRDGRGPSNWGNATQESARAAKSPAEGEEAEDQKTQSEQEESKPSYVPTTGIFADSDDEEYEQPKLQKKVYTIPDEYANMVNLKEDQDIVVEHEEEEEQFELGFKSYAEVHKEKMAARAAHNTNAPRGGRGRGRGRGGVYRPRDGQKTEEKRGPGGVYRPHDGQRTEEKRGPGGVYRPRDGQRTEEKRGPGGVYRPHDGQKTEEKRGPRRNAVPRDQHPTKVQHQRNSNRTLRMNEENFPRLK